MTETAASQAARALRSVAGTDPFDLAVIMGSGWAPVAEALSRDCPDALRCTMSELPGFTAPGATGHRDQVQVLQTAGRRVLVFVGRTHYYEQRDVAAAVHAVRTAAAAGAGAVLLTNAAGSLRPEWGPGTTVLIRDHLNLTGDSPLRGPRFVDMTDAYSQRLRAHARARHPHLPEGVYAQVAGPQYETPAEVRMLAALGADLVGMSTAIETIAAREAGLSVLAFSLVTNLAAGTASATGVQHAEVLAAGRSAAAGLAGLLADLIATWPLAAP